jgi:tetratricopeptide (TPR) repeat protein
MKDYLQLDGLVYKLVPIRTAVDKRNPFDMGRIDSDKMYDIVMEWDWGNSGSPDIYHDTETRRNGISYRSNLARLAETLINEGKKEKAENILDLAMEKMPVQYFEYYSLLEPFILGYYELDRPEKARAIFEDVSKKYQENLLFFSGMKIKRQYALADEIISNMERYRSIVDITIVLDSEEYGKDNATEFNNHLTLFRHFYGEEEGIDLESEPEGEEGIETEVDSAESADTAVAGIAE